LLAFVPQIRLGNTNVRVSGAKRAGEVFTPSPDAFSAAGRLLASLANREGWTADAHPSLVHDALLAASCRESGITLITRDRDFARLKTVLRGWRFVAPWPEVSQ